MIRKFSVLCVAVLLAAAHPAGAQRFIYTGLPDADVVAFLGKLQKAVGAGDRAAVAGMVKYPLRVNRDATHHATIATSADLLKQYDAVFTPGIRVAIVKETPAKMSGGKDGAAIAAGLVWIAGVCDTSTPRKCRLGVSSVNLHGSK
jgi:hypothetical protein